MKNKTKGEQFFILMAVCVALFGVLMLCGCGGCACEMPKAGCKSDSDVRVAGVSIPGCGGCITPGKGCNSCLWAQACKATCASDTVGSDDTFNALTFDNQYYGGGCGGCSGCLGCSSTPHNCYGGCLNIKSSGGNTRGIFFSCTGDKETFIGSTSEGCGCNGNRLGAWYTGIIETTLGID